MPNQEPRRLDRAITKHVALDYLLHVPKAYAQDDATAWPLILFLHGAGERGSDLELVKKHGIPRIVEEQADFPFITVSPQCPLELDWTWQTDALLALLDDITQAYRVDPARIYLTGLSMGGFGTWALAQVAPERFAAIAPICGGGNRRRARRLVGIPTWVFHGAKDDVVPLKASEEMVEALKNAGGDVTFTVYPEAKHDSWTETYANPELYRWFLSHRK